MEWQDTAPDTSPSGAQIQMGRDQLDRTGIQESRRLYQRTQTAASSSHDGYLMGIQWPDSGPVLWDTERWCLHRRLHRRRSPPTDRWWNRRASDELSVGRGSTEARWSTGENLIARGWGYKPAEGYLRLSGPAGKVPTVKADSLADPEKKLGCRCMLVQPDLSPVEYGSFHLSGLWRESGQVVALNVSDLCLVVPNIKTGDDIILVLMHQCHITEITHS